MHKKINYPIDWRWEIQVVNGFGPKPSRPPKSIMGKYPKKKPKVKPCFKP